MHISSTYQPGDLIGGVYHVHQCLIGGMGEVYLCLDIDNHEPYALKTIHAHARPDPDARQAFEREITTWIALGHHPNIVRCCAVKIFDGQPFMLLEWVACDEYCGNDLRSRIAAGALDVRSALETAIDIARGLAHAQQKQPGIVHCDLKPENILIDQGRVAKITDFGLSRIFQAAPLTIPPGNDGPGRFQAVPNKRRIVGTPAYMAPEQWRGDPLDARTDIYALGCVLYEMVTGHWVFAGSTLTGFRRNHLEAEIPHLADNLTFPPTLDAVLARCLAKDPADRFASAEDVAQSLTDVYFQEFCARPRAAATGNGFSAIDFNNRGSAYARLRCYADALRDFDAAIAAAPAYAIAYVNRGSVHATLGRHADALEDYTHALALDPGDPLTYLLRGRAYAGIGEHHAALADYTQAIRLEPVDAAGYYWRGKTYRALRKPDRALTDFGVAAMLNPEYADAYDEAGDMLAQQGNFHEARAFFKKAARFGSVAAVRHIARIDDHVAMTAIIGGARHNHALAPA